jgi:hypothetical protein
VKEILAGARRQPGPNPHKVYDALKNLFREVDGGSPPASGIKLYGYNGELFKPHPLLLGVTFACVRVEALKNCVIRGLKPGAGIKQIHFWECFG